MDIYTVAAELQGSKDLIIQTFRPDITLNPAYERIKPFSPDKMTRIKANVSDIMSGKTWNQDLSELRPNLRGGRRTVPVGDCSTFHSSTFQSILTKNPCLFALAAIRISGNKKGLRGSPTGLV